MRISGSLTPFAFMITFLLILQHSSKAQRFDLNKGKTTLSGILSAQKSGETIIAATVTVSGHSSSAISNQYGFYSLTLPRGIHTFLFTAIGFKAFKIQLDLNRDSNFNVSLTDTINELNTVNITAIAGQRDLGNPQMGIERINVSETNNIPVLLGERDILKTLQLLPGVKTGGEGNGGLYVRGGGADQNLILLDEAHVYNASHLLGFFSTFNSDALKNVTLYKSGMPAQYGGRLSSVLDAKMNDGNKKRFGGSAGIGLISARINLEGPIQKEQSSFLISARRTYADLFLNLARDSNVNGAKLYFYDINAKANYNLGTKDRLFLSMYLGKDVLGSRDRSGINWGNATATLRWNHVFSNQVFSNTSIIFSNYDFKISEKSDDDLLTLYSQIMDWNFKEDLQWYLNERNTLSIGLNAVYHTIKPGEVQSDANSDLDLLSMQNRYSLENAIYASNTWKAGSALSITYGIRFSTFSILGKGDYYTVNGEGDVTSTLSYRDGQLVKNYLNIEPRVSASLQVNNNTAIKSSYVRNAQNLHLISNSNSVSPTDRWIASTNIIEPEISNQVSLGFYKDLPGNSYELTLESYYKGLKNQIDYRNGANVFSSMPIETQLLYGIGRAYGLEFLVKKTAGRLTGWLAYTISKTERKIEGISNNNWYNARQDRPHDLSLVGIYQLNRKWTLSANWLFSTGNAVTFPNGKYQVMEQIYYYYSSRNADRMPDYHRLDIGANCLLKQTDRFTSELNFSLYNAYGRENAYQINFKTDDSDPSRTQALQTTLFKFVPSISYNFKF